jgi:hypothetical protein
MSALTWWTAYGHVFFGALRSLDVEEAWNGRPNSIPQPDL